MVASTMRMAPSSVSNLSGSVRSAARTFSRTFHTPTGIT